MKKNIDIPDEIVKDLKKIAVDADRDLKNYIQDLLVEHVRNVTGLKPKPRQRRSVKQL